MTDAEKSAIVIGAGIVGVSSAVHLQRHGFRVTGALFFEAATGPRSSCNAPAGARRTTYRKRPPRPI